MVVASFRRLAGLNGHEMVAEGRRRQGIQRSGDDFGGAACNGELDFVELHQGFGVIVIQVVEVPTVQGDEVACDVHDD